MGLFWKNLKTTILTLLGMVMLTSLSTAWCADNAKFVSQSVTTAMIAGQTYSVSVTFKNTGTTKWTATGNYRLGSQNPQDNGTWGEGRIYLANGESVAAGASKTFTFSVNAPTTAGTYNFQWKMLQENVQWFGDLSTNQSVAVCAAPSFGDSKKNTSVYVQSCYSQLALQHSSCTQGSAFSDSCNAAINRTCQSNGYVSGYGPVEHSGDAVNFVCVNSSAASYTKGTYSNLAKQHSVCKQSSAFSDSCNAAISRSCQASGYVSGFGPVEHSGDSAHYVCVNSTAASSVQGSYSNLVKQHSECKQSAAFSDSCNAAISRTCSASGYVSGFGPVEHSGDAANYVCTKSTANLLFGFKMDRAENNDPKYEAYFQLAQELGLDYVVLPVTPNMSDDKTKWEGGWNYEESIDKFEGYVKKYGVSVYPAFYDNGSLSQVEYSTFVRSFLDRYQDTMKIKRIEFNNEPESGTVGTTIWWKKSAKELADYNSSAYDFVKSKYPNILVGTSGFLASSTDSTDDAKRWKFFGDYFKKTTKFDFLAIHHYPKSSGYLQQLKPVSGENHFLSEYDDYSSFRKLLDQNGHSGKSILVSEGSTTMPLKKNSDSNLDWNWSSSEEEAVLLAERFSLAFSNQSTSGVIGSMVSDITKSDANSADTNSYLFKWDDNTKKATRTVKFTYLQKIIKMLRQYPNYVRRVSGKVNSTGVWVEQFQSSTGKNMWLAFCPLLLNTALQDTGAIYLKSKQSDEACQKTDTQIEIGRNISTVSYFKLGDQNGSLSVRGGKISLKLGATPVFIEEK